MREGWMKPYKYDRDKFVEAVQGSGGILSTIAARLGVERYTVARWRDNLPEVQEIIADETEKTLDMAENGLIVAARDGDLKAINFLLSTKGKNRGFTTKVENNLSGEISTKSVVTVYLPDNQRGDFSQKDS